MVEDTLLCIRKSMLTLLAEKKYSEIQMKEIAEKAHVGRRTLYRYFENKELIVRYIAESLMDNFAKEMEKQVRRTLESVIYSFYAFMDNSKMEVLLLKKACLLSYIEDKLFDIITWVAFESKYRDTDSTELARKLCSVPKEDRYALEYIFAGCWRIAMLWIENDEQTTVEEITRLTVSLLGAFRLSN